MWLSGLRSFVAARLALLDLRLAARARLDGCVKLAESDEHFLAQATVDGDQVRQQADEQRLDAGDEKRRGEDERLDVTAVLALRPMEDEPSAEHEAGQQHQHADGEEGLQRLVESVDAEDRRRGLAQVRTDAAVEAGGPRRRIRADSHRLHAEVAVARLDDRLQRVGEGVEDVDLQRRLAGEGPEATRDVGDVNARDETDGPASGALQQAL